jgi:hypothetical protein
MECASQEVIRTVFRPKKDVKPSQKQLFIFKESFLTTLSFGGIFFKSKKDLDLKIIWLVCSIKSMSWFMSLKGSRGWSVKLEIFGLIISKFKKCAT